MPSKMFQGTFLPFVFKKIVLVEAAWRNKAMKRVVVVGGGGGSMEIWNQPTKYATKIKVQGV